MSWKIVILVRSETLELFGNTLSRAHIYSCYRREKLSQHIQTVLYQKRRIFCQIFIAFSESTQVFAYFETKDQLHSSNISEVIDPEKCGYFNARKLLF